MKSFFIVLQGEIPSITKLATTASLSTKINEAKNKIPNTKMSEIKKKY